MRLFFFTFLFSFFRGKCSKVDDRETAFDVGSIIWCYLPFVRLLVGCHNFLKWWEVTRYHCTLIVKIEISRVKTIHLIWYLRIPLFVFIINNSQLYYFFIILTSNIREFLFYLVWSAWRWIFPHNWSTLHKHFKLRNKKVKPRPPILADQPTNGPSNQPTITRTWGFIGMLHSQQCQLFNLKSPWTQIHNKWWS